MIARGINHQLNTLERIQNDHSLDAPAVIELEKLIAPHLKFLADVAGAEAPYLARECLLTSFSLHPLPATLRRIRQAALDTGRIQQPSTCPVHEVYVQPVGGVAAIQCPTCTALIKPPSTETDALTGIRLITQFDYDHTVIPCMLLHNELHLCSRISGGIVSLLSRPRHKSLSWLLEWDSLKAACEKLMDARTKYNVATLQVHGANERLENIDLDYELFEHLPDQDYGGWEKGYEDLDSQDDDDEVEHVPVRVKVAPHTPRPPRPKRQRRSSTTAVAPPTVSAPQRRRRGSHTQPTETRVQLLGETSEETPSEFESASADEALEEKREQDYAIKKRKQREGKSRRAALRRALLSLDRKRKPDKRKVKPLNGQPAKIRKRRESVRAPTHARKPAAGNASGSVAYPTEASPAPLVNKPGNIRKRRDSLLTPVNAQRSTVTKIMRSLKASGARIPQARPADQIAESSRHQSVATDAVAPTAPQTGVSNGNFGNYQRLTVWTQWRNDLSNWERLANLRRRFEYLQTRVNMELVAAAER